MSKFTKEKNDKWLQSIGIYSINNVDADLVGQILQMSSKELQSKELRELQLYLIALSRYKMYIIKETGFLKAKLDSRSKHLENSINIAASKSRAATREERRALAIQGDGEVGKLFDQIEELEAKYTQLRNLPDGIQSFIDKIDRLEYRKADELREEKHLND